MKEVFSHEKYCDFLKMKKIIGRKRAEDYKKPFIPLYLYKYLAFESEYFESSIENLLEGKIWMPKASTLNDPFEFEMLKDELSAEKRMEFRDDILERNLVLSLCDGHKNNLLWAHYANAHKGVCFEFIVDRNDKIFPITYKRYQEDITNEILKWLEIKESVIERKLDTTPEEDYLIARLSRIMYIKHSDWKYEKEFRISYRDLAIKNKKGAEDTEDVEDDYNITPGDYVKLEQLGIRLQRVILGFNCSIINKAKVIELVNQANRKMIMKRMTKIGFEKSMDEIVRELSEEGCLVTIFQKYRKGNTMSLSLRELRKDRDNYHYDI